jgi:RNA polymerase sigma-54 factor
MKAALQLKLGQQLTLTPQLRQAIRLLQLSSLELETELNAALESNPLLERAEEGETEGEADFSPAEAVSTPEPEVAAADTPTEGDFGEDLDYEPLWDEEFVGSGRQRDGDEDGPGELVAAATEDLREHLQWQLNLMPFSPRDLAIGTALIEAIDDDGYLRESLDDVAAGLLPEIAAEADEMAAVLHAIQRLDPLGCGARSLAECLDVQLGALDPDTPGRSLARSLVREHLEALPKADCARLGRQLGEAPEAVEAALALIRSLDPRPGAQIAPASIEYVVPDAFVQRQGGMWRVSLAPHATPRLGVNRHYESLIGRAAKGDANYLRGQLQEARWLIKSLASRADTLLRVVQCIVKHQCGFLEHGPEAMRPLVLREVADELGLHESTVSRVTTRKYLHTPRGTFELKYFFSSSLATSDGGAASSTAIQAMLRRLIEAEDPKKPVSDANLAKALKQQGITVARRTVAKYREAMNIPASNERQRLG